MNLLHKSVVELRFTKQRNKPFDRKFILVEKFNRKSNMKVIFNHKVSTHLTILFPSKSVKLELSFH